MSGTIHLQTVTEPSAWRAAELRADRSWVHRLTAENVADLEAALARVKARGLAIVNVEAQDFPLPSLAPLLERVREELQDGRGLALVKGLPVGRYTDEDAAIIFWGIGTQLGTAITQNAAADLMGHVYDRGLDYTQRTVRAYQVRAELLMHCDNSDLVGLLCLRQARAGGASLLSSAMTIYNEILRTHPEHLGVLFSGFVYDRKGEQGPGEPAFSQKIPVFSVSHGVVSCRYARSYIEQAPKSTGIALSPTEREVLDHFDAVARRDDVRFGFTMEPGDMQFANNYLVLHGRTEFDDHPEVERKRHLLRLWLEVPGLRDIASDAVRFGFTRFGNHGKTAREWLARASAPA